ncbi:MAG: Fic family protein [Flavobacteriales bacterium]|nr:Fic family protein [Flavobacteriales bacterium]MCB0757685.1 Fic family protein [Flavobacteriales bacterium]
MAAREGDLIGYISTLQGIVANAALDGNSLSEDQVDRLLEGSLQLPPSQMFLEREIRNLVKAVSWTQARTRSGDRDTGPWVIQMLNAQVLKELPSSIGSAGEYRTSASQGKVRPEDIAPLMERLHTWTESDLFRPENEAERMAFSTIRAILTHLYLLWIEPFAEGNGRTARMVEFQLLLNAGIPAAAAHRMAMHVAATRNEYARQVARAAGPEGDVIPFIAYMVRGFADGVKALLAEVSEAQYQLLAEEELRNLVDPTASSNGERLQRLALGLHAHRAKIATAQVPQLSPELAHVYARLNAKTLQRDLVQLEELGLVERSRGEVRAKPLAVRPFATTG